MNGHTERHHVEAWANGTLTDDQVERMLRLVRAYEQQYPDRVATPEARQDYADEIEDTWRSAYRTVTR